MKIALWIVGTLVVLVIVAVLLARTPDFPVAEARAKYASPASKFLTLSPGLTVHVRDEGLRDGPALLLIHGSNASLQTWEPWVARLKDRYRIVSLDLPGHGLTGADPLHDYSTARYVEIVEQVAAAEGLTHFTIFGNSMGGWVAWSYATTHKDQIERLVLVDASHPYETERADLPLALRIATTPGIREIAATITPRWLLEMSLKPAVYDPKVMTPAMVDRYWELLRYPGNRTATIDRFAGPPDKAPAMGALDVPALVLWGREDQFIPVAAAEWFRGRLPNGRVVILDRIGHVGMEEDPDRSLAPVLEFLAQTTTVPAARPAAR